MDDPAVNLRAQCTEGFQFRAEGPRISTDQCSTNVFGTIRVTGDFSARSIEVGSQLPGILGFDQ